MVQFALFAEVMFVPVPPYELKCVIMISLTDLGQSASERLNKDVVMSKAKNQGNQDSVTTAGLLSIKYTERLKQSETASLSGPGRKVSFLVNLQEKYNALKAEMKEHQANVTTGIGGLSVILFSAHVYQESRV